MSMSVNYATANYMSTQGQQQPNLNTSSIVVGSNKPVGARHQHNQTVVMNSH